MLCAIAHEFSVLAHLHVAAVIIRMWVLEQSSKAGSELLGGEGMQFPPGKQLVAVDKRNYWTVWWTSFPSQMLPIFSQVPPLTLSILPSW